MERLRVVMPACCQAAAAVWTTLLLVWPAAVTAGPIDAPTVTAQNIAFAPQVLTVAPGTIVTWTNGDPVQHTVTADDGSFDSGLFDAGAAFSHTFDNPGTYAYYCSPHGGAGGVGMAGVVVVADVAAGQSPSGARTLMGPP